MKPAEQRSRLSPNKRFYHNYAFLWTLVQSFEFKLTVYPFLCVFFPTNVFVSDTDNHLKDRLDDYILTLVQIVWVVLRQEHGM